MPRKHWTDSEWPNGVPAPAEPPRPGPAPLGPVYVLIEHAPKDEEPVVVVGVFASREGAEAAEAASRAKNASRDEWEPLATWPEDQAEWELEWLIEEVMEVQP